MKKAARGGSVGIAKMRSAVFLRSRRINRRRQPSEGMRELRVILDDRQAVLFEHPRVEIGDHVVIAGVAIEARHRVKIANVFHAAS